MARECRYQCHGGQSVGGQARPGPGAGTAKRQAGVLGAPHRTPAKGIGAPAGLAHQRHVQARHQARSVA
eukprot:2478669-Lingulodinium_polyedra.AAC.1